MTLNGVDYRHHRDAGEFVWLAALDAGVAGPFYFVRRSEIPTAEGRDARIKAAQARLASLPVNGPEYMAALGEMTAAMRGGARG